MNTPPIGAVRGLWRRIGTKAIVMMEPTPVILLDLDTTRRERRELIAHELAHVERNGGADAAGMPDTWRDVVARDEAACDRIATEQLIPCLALLDFVGRHIDPVHAWQVAEHFDVPERVAKRALAALARPRAVSDDIDAC